MGKSSSEDKHDKSSTKKSSSHHHHQHKSSRDKDKKERKSHRRSRSRSASPKQRKHSSSSSSKKASKREKHRSRSRSPSETSSMHRKRVRKSLSPAEDAYSPSHSSSSRHKKSTKDYEKHHRNESRGRDDYYTNKMYMERQRSYSPHPSDDRTRDLAEELYPLSAGNPYNEHDDRTVSELAALNKQQPPSVRPPQRHHSFRHDNELMLATDTAHYRSRYPPAVHQQPRQLFTKHYATGAPPPRFNNHPYFHHEPYYDAQQGGALLAPPTTQNPYYVNNMESNSYYQQQSQFTQPRMLSFKEYSQTLDPNDKLNKFDAVRQSKYNQYKETFRAEQTRAFFEAHKTRTGSGCATSRRSGASGGRSTARRCSRGSPTFSTSTSHTKATS